MKIETIVARATPAGESEEREVARLEAEIPETIEEAVKLIGAERLLFNAVRQLKQDLANRAREDFKRGGDRLAREARVKELGERAKAGDPEAMAEMIRLASRAR